jgi:hypothetical protein
MANGNVTDPTEVAIDPLARAKQLAEKMAGLLETEEVSDAALAVAMLTTGVVAYHTTNAVAASGLMRTIRQMEDKLLLAAAEPGLPKLQ